MKKMPEAKKLKPGPKRKLSDSARKKSKKAANAKLSKNRIYIGDEYDCWIEIKTALRLETNSEVANILLDTDRKVMGGNCCRYEEKTIDIVAGNIIHGDDNVIIDNRTKPYIHPSTSTLSDGSQSERPSINVVAQDIVIGHRNEISKGQSSKELPPTSWTTSTNGTTSQQGSAGDMAKKNDDKDYIRNREIVVKASKSVGIIRGPGRLTGTGFRVGDCYIMTALHVVDDVMKTLQAPGNKIDYKKVVDEKFYIEFEYKTHNRKQNPDNLFNFSDVVYTNKDLDTAILKLSVKQDKSYPPSIGRFEQLREDRPVYLIGHPNGEPMMDDPKIEIYNYSEEEVNKSNKWANTTLESDRNYYEGIDNPIKTLFHCASQHGASGGLGVMVMPHHDDPIGVLMLLKGYPEFYYSKKLSFSSTEKENFLIVEQGVLLKSIEDDRELDSDLKNEIFGNVILH